MKDLVRLSSGQSVGCIFNMSCHHNLNEKVGENIFD